jgi:hypothetical protein
MTMTDTYIATIKHHSLARAHKITIRGSLAYAKRRASKEFGDGFLDHEIVIYKHNWCDALIPVAHRRIADRKWTWSIL